MGRDGKLTRSLLPGALGAENKERQKQKRMRERMRKRRGRKGDRGWSRVIGDRLARARTHFLPRCSLLTIEAIYLSGNAKSIEAEARIASISPD